MTSTSTVTLDPSFCVSFNCEMTQYLFNRIHQHGNEMPLDVRPIFTVLALTIGPDYYAVHTFICESHRRLSHSGWSRLHEWWSQSVSLITSQSRHANLFFEITHLGQIQRFCQSERGEQRAATQWSARNGSFCYNNHDGRILSGSGVEYRGFSRKLCISYEDHLRTWITNTKHRTTIHSLSWSIFRSFEALEITIGSCKTRMNNQMSSIHEWRSIYRTKSAIFIITRSTADRKIAHHTQLQNWFRRRVG